MIASTSVSTLPVALSDVRQGSKRASHSRVVSPAPKHTTRLEKDDQETPENANVRHQHACAEVLETPNPRERHLYARLLGKYAKIGGRG